MADLATILKDPNYINANDATKAAIFLKYAPQDPNYANANDATKQAIHEKFGVQNLGADIGESVGAAMGSNEPREPTTYEKIRPYLAPTVEALGAAGGAALGIPMGPPGVVGGAGLGYGIGSELMYNADVAFGARKPRQGAEQIVEPLTNMLTGATFEAGGQAVAPIIAKSVGKVLDMRQIPQQKAARIAQTAMGTDMPQVINALRNAPANASVAELTAGIENPRWQALVNDALQKDSQFLRKMRLADEQQSVNALTKLAGGGNAAEVRGTLETAKSNLNTVTGPQREAAIKRANLGKSVADEATAREANDLAVAMGSGGQIDPVRFAAQASGAEKALRSVGIAPLETAPIIARLKTVTDKPEFAGNDLLAGATKNVADDLVKWTANNGVIDANALEAIRKNSVNAAIQQLRPGADATTQRNLAAGVLAKIKPAIDDAIEAAGGAGWKDYLTNHAQGMQKIAERELTGEGLKLWTSGVEGKDKFVRLVQNGLPDDVEKILGPGKYNIAVELADNTLKVMQTQAQKHLTKMSVAEQIPEGQKALAQLLAQQTSNFRFPSWLNFWTTASNKAISELEKRIGTKSMAVLTEAFKTPQGTASLLETLPGAERSRVLQLLSNPKGLVQKSAAPTTIGVTNALAPENQNNLR